MREPKVERADIPQGERSPVAAVASVLVLLALVGGALLLPRYALPVIEEDQDPPEAHYSGLCWACHRTAD